MFQLCYWLRCLTSIVRVTRFYLSILLIILCLSFSAVADSLNLNDIVVLEKDGVYHINITTEIAAAEEHVRQVLTDYIHIYRLSDSIIKSKVFESSVDEKTLIETVILCDIPVVCKEVTLVEEVSTLESGNLQTVILPEKSDFRSGKAVWAITAKGEKTQLTYQASIEPDFFIPPILGTQMVIAKMRNEYKTALYHIEHIARINEEREWDEDFAFANVDDNADDEQCNNELIENPK